MAGTFDVLREDFHEFALGKFCNNAMNLAANISFPLLKFEKYNLPFIPVTLNNLCS
jgi:hypothetical protein